MGQPQSQSHEAELASYYHEYQQPLLRFLMSLVQQRETAEDLCQETFIKAFRAWHTRDVGADPRGWLFRIARNTAYDYFRQQRRNATSQLPEDESLLGQTPEPEAQLAETEDIQATLQQIAPHYRVPLVLYSYAGYDIRDIAHIMGCTTTTIKTRLHRARNQFRQHYSSSMATSML